mgnify:CR=1 FL=1
MQRQTVPASSGVSKIAKYVVSPPMVILEYRTDCLRLFCCLTPPQYGIVRVASSLRLLLLLRGDKSWGGRATHVDSAVHIFGFLLGRILQQKIRLGVDPRDLLGASRVHTHTHTHPGVLFCSFPVLECQPSTAPFPRKTPRYLFLHPTRDGIKGKSSGARLQSSFVVLAATW